PEQFPAIFKKGNVSNIEELTVSLPSSTSANDSLKMLTISLYRKSDRAVSKPETYSKDKIKKDVDSIINPLRDKAYKNVVDIKTQDLLSQTLPLPSEREIGRA